MEEQIQFGLALGAKNCIAKEPLLDIGDEYKVVEIETEVE